MPDHLMPVSKFSYIERNSLVYAYRQSGCEFRDVAKYGKVSIFNAKKICTNFQTQLELYILHSKHNSMNKGSKAYVKDSLGNEINASELATIHEKSISQIANWIVDHGFSTLQQIINKIVFNGINGRRSIYIKDANGNVYSCSEVGKRLNIKTARVRYCYRALDCDTIEKIVEQESKGSGSVSKILKTYPTKYGDLNVNEIHDHHPFNYEITTKTIYSRLSRRDGMCPSLWWEKMQSVDFATRLIDEGLEPTATGKFIKKATSVNRTNACMREKGQLRCIHYRARWLSEGNKPKECSVAKVDTCEGFSGKLIEPGRRDPHGESIQRSSSNLCGVNYTPYTKI